MVLLFKRLARQGDVNGVVYLLKKAIPEYKSLNSELFASFERGEHIPFDLEEAHYPADERNDYPVTQTLYKRIATAKRYE